jgi:hypothetical protein
MTGPSEDGFTPGPRSFDLGHGHRGEYSQWAPDRELNPMVAHLPDVEKWGLLIFHTNPQGHPCAGFVTFAGEVQREISPTVTTWDVISWEPLTITPSVLCSCGDHGFITGGRWIPA